MLRLTDHLAMTIAIVWEVKPQTGQAKIMDRNTLSILIFWKFSQVYFKLVKAAKSNMHKCIGIFNMNQLV